MFDEFRCLGLYEAARTLGEVLAQPYIVPGSGYFCSGTRHSRAKLMGGLDKRCRGLEKDTQCPTVVPHRGLWRRSVISNVKQELLHAVKLRRRGAGRDIEETIARNVAQRMPTARPGHFAARHESGGQRSASNETTYDYGASSDGLLAALSSSKSSCSTGYNHAFPYTSLLPP